MANMQRVPDRSDFIRRRGPPGPNEVFQFRFLIPSKAASVIIGTSGERIQRLMQECNSRLSILDSKGPERVFMIEGSMEGCVKVWADCFPDLKDVMGSESRKTGEEMDLRFLCHNSIVGSIIGKAGSRVKELRATFMLSLIKVHQEMAPKSTDRVIQIVGEPNKIFECFKVMYAELESQNIRGHVENFNSENSNEQLTMTYGGWPSESGRRHGGPSLMGNGGLPYSQPLTSYDGGRNSDPAMDQYGGLRNSAPPIDQFGGARNVVPPMNQYGGTRSAAPTIDQYGGGKSLAPSTEQYGGECDDGLPIDQFGGERNGPPPMNQYGGGRNAAPPMDQYGGGRNAPPPMDQYGGGRNAPPPVDQYGGGRNAPPPIDQYGGGRNGQPPMDQYGGGRNAPPPMDQYGGGRNGPPPTDQYGGGRNAPPHMDQYGGGRNGPPHTDQYGGGRNGPPTTNQYGGGRNAPPPMDQYGGGRNDSPNADQYGVARNGPPSMDKYGGGRNVEPHMDQFGGPRNAESSMNNYGGGKGGVPAMDQYGGRKNVGQPISSYGGGENNVQSMDRLAGGRKVVPLMDQFGAGGDFDSQEDYYEPPSRPSFEEGHSGMDSRSRRPFPDDRQMATKKPRVWNNDKPPYNARAPLEATNVRNPIASSPNKTTPGNVDVSLPASCLSALQGVGGEKLFNIMKDSGADIVVKPEDGLTEERILTLKGTKDQIEGAQYLLQMCMKRYMLNL